MHFACASYAIQWVLTVPQTLVFGDPVESRVSTLGNKNYYSFTLSMKNMEISHQNTNVFKRENTKIHYRLVHIQYIECLKVPHTL